MKTDKDVLDDICRENDGMFDGDVLARPEVPPLKTDKGDLVAILLWMAIWFLIGRVCR